MKNVFRFGHLKKLYDNRKRQGWTCCKFWMIKNKRDIMKVVEGVTFVRMTRTAITTDEREMENGQSYWISNQNRHIPLESIIKLRDIKL